MIVYKMVNQINGKTYVGQTVKPLQQRIAEHKRNKTSLIGRAINKYGLQNFKCEVIAECETFEELDRLEIFWIKELNSKSPNGYNILDGGQAHRTKYYFTKKIEFERKNLFGKCPFVTAQELLAGKWTILILHELSSGAKRFNELQKEIEITHSTLSVQLKNLEREGLVHREVFPEVPPRVEYSLTEIGKSFQPVLDSIEIWGKNYIEYLKTRDAKKR